MIVVVHTPDPAGRRAALLMYLAYRILAARVQRGVS